MRSYFEAPARAREQVFIPKPTRTQENLVLVDFASLFFGQTIPIVSPRLIQWVRDLLRRSEGERKHYHRC